MIYTWEIDRKYEKLRTITDMLINCEAMSTCIIGQLVKITSSVERSWRDVYFTEANWKSIMMVAESRYKVVALTSIKPIFTKDVQRDLELED